MRSLALFLALLALLVGLVALVRPDVLLALGERVITPTGLYGIAALRVVVGLLLVLVARDSRTPTLLRVLGTIIVLAGLSLPILGVDRTRGMLDWETAQGGGLLRLAGVVIVGFGAFLALTLRPVRRAT